MTGKALLFFKKKLRFGHFHRPWELDRYNHNVDIDIGVDVDDGAGLVVDGDVDVAVDVGGDFTISFVRPALDGRRQKQPLTAGTYSTASQHGLSFEDFQAICKKKVFFLRTICKNMSGQTISKKEVYSDALYCVGAVSDIFHWGSENDHLLTDNSCSNGTTHRARLEWLT